MPEDGQRIADRIAKPGDADLDIDVDGVTITAVVRHGCELLVRACGGFGTWLDDGRAVTDDYDVEVTSVELVGRWPAEQEQLVIALSERLEQWRDRAVPLRVLGAPGRMFTIIEDRSNWIPLPRST